MYIRLGGSIVVHVFQLHFLVDYLPLGEQQRGFTPRTSVSSLITHRVFSLCLHLPSLYLCLLFSAVDLIYNWLRLISNSIYSLCSFSAHSLFDIKLELVNLLIGGLNVQGCFYTI